MDRRHNETAVHCRPSFRGIISKLGGTLLKRTQLIEKFLPKVMEQTVREVLKLFFFLFIFFNFFFFAFGQKRFVVLLMVKNSITALHLTDGHQAKTRSYIGRLPPCTGWMPTGKCKGCSL